MPCHERTLPICEMDLKTDFEEVQPLFIRKNMSEAVSGGTTTKRSSDTVFSLPRSVLARFTKRHQLSLAEPRKPCAVFGILFGVNIKL